MKSGTRQTFAYGRAEDGGRNLEFAPVKEGMICTAWSCKDLFEEYDQAMRLLAMISEEAVDDPQQAATDFFKAKKDSTYNYYDPEESEGETLAEVMKTLTTPASDE